MALKFKSYSGRYGFGREGGATAVFTCLWSERFTQKAILLGAGDANDPTLKCNSVRIEYAGGDPFCGYAQLTCDFMPIARVEAKRLNAAMTCHYEYSSESFTISGKGWTWASGKQITNQNILPVKIIKITDIILSGTRAVVDLSTYDAYDDCCNSAAFKGAPAGCVLFSGASADERTLDDGSIVSDVQIKLRRRSIPWNQFFNEDTGAWEEIKQTSGGTKMFELVSFAPLLQAVTTP
jgi:hypothetical protein